MKKAKVDKPTIEIVEKDENPEIKVPKEPVIAQKVVEKLSIYDQNVQHLTKFQKTKTHEQLKYTNPLRDYSHIHSGRLLKALIDTNDGKKVKKKQIAKLRKDVLKYQKD